MERLPGVQGFLLNGDVLLQVGDVCVQRRRIIAVGAGITGDQVSRDLSQLALDVLQGGQHRLVLFDGDGEAADRPVRQLHHRLQIGHCRPGFPCLLSRQLSVSRALLQGLLLRFGGPGQRLEIRVQLLDARRQVRRPGNIGAYSGSQGICRLRVSVHACRQGIRPLGVLLHACLQACASLLQGLAALCQAVYTGCQRTFLLIYGVQAACQLIGPCFQGSLFFI